MTLPGPTGGTYGPNQNLQLSWLDQSFAAVGALGVIPCTATGTNTITLTPNPNTPTVSAYANYNQFSFVAIATTTGLVSVQVGALPSLPLYSQGSTAQQASAGTLVAGILYIIGYNSALGTGGGFAIISAISVPGQYVKRNFGARGGGGRALDAQILSGNNTVNSPSNSFANAVIGMYAAVVDGGVGNAMGRPSTLITPITNASAGSITLASAPLQSTTISFTATVVSGSATLTNLNINPPTAGVRHNMVLSGAGVSGLTVFTETSSTLTMSATTSFSGGGISIVATGQTTVCFGYDDSAAFNNAISQAGGYGNAVYVEDDNYLLLNPWVIGGTSQAAHTVIPVGSPLLMFAVSTHSADCISVSGYNLGAGPLQTAGQQFAPWSIGYFEADCCNTGQDGFAVGPSTYSTANLRVVNSYRDMVAEKVSGTGWIESCRIAVTGSMAGHHMHSKRNLASGVYQNINQYLIHGRFCGLNSGLILNSVTITSQLGTGAWIYDGGSGIQTSTWQDGCSFDGGRNVALCYGSDNNPTAFKFVDVTQNYVIEGNATTGNTYEDNHVGKIAIEDTSVNADARDQPPLTGSDNTDTSGLTIDEFSNGPWGNSAPLISKISKLNAGQFINTRYAFPNPIVSYKGDFQISTGSAFSAEVQMSVVNSGVVAPRPQWSNKASNIFAVTATSTTLISSDTTSYLFIARDNTSGGLTVGTYDDAAGITFITTGISGIGFSRLSGTGLQAKANGGTIPRNIITIAFETG